MYSEFDNAITSNNFCHRNVPTQSNLKSEARRFEDIFDRPLIYRKVINLGWQAVIGEIEHGVTTGDLMQMREHAPSDR